MDIEAYIRQMIAEELDRREREKVKGDPSEILKAADIARQYGYSTETVSFWCRTGMIRGADRPAGGHWRFTREAFDSFLARRKAA